MAALISTRSNYRSHDESPTGTDPRGRILGEIRLLLAKESSIHVTFVDDSLVLEGEVDDIRRKRLAISATEQLAGHFLLVDHLRIKTAEHLTDVAVRDHLIQALLDEPLLKRCLIHSRLPQVLQSHRKSLPEAQGTIVAAVSDGIVTLNGEVASLIQKWLTGVLAWWTPGCRDVVDELVNVPAQEDNDDAVTETVRLALEKDLFVNATKVQVSTKDRVVTLRGMVPNEAMMQLAERDSWYVAGVKNVVNQLAVKW